MEHADYRPDIDGLRALAVVSVILFHVAPESFPGGFAGVDVFFVISGYLISKIILRALRRGTFSLLDFYSRRVKRIFPALLLMLATVWIMGWLLLLPDEYEQLGKHIVAGGAFAQNLTLFADTREYFGSINSPLVHLWSLGVEEQFYLVWPILLMLSAKMGKAQLSVIAVLGVASFIANVALISSHPLASFYLPFCRLWELALGGMIAHRHCDLTHSDGKQQSMRSVHLLGIAGVLLVLASFVMLNSHLAFPGWWALAPCVGAALIIHAGSRSWVNHRLLSRPEFVFVGLISYPLYLWHWPLLSFAHKADWQSFTAGPISVLIMISVGLAYLTYRFVERPIRSSKLHRPVAAALCVVMAAWIAIGYLAMSGRATGRPLPNDVARVARVLTEAYPYPDDEGFFRVGTGSREVLFIGDSTIAQYHSRVAKILAEHSELSLGAIFAWKPGCAPDRSMSLVDPPACEALIERAMQYAKRPEVSTVVIGFCWYAYFVGILDDDHVGEPGPLVAGTDLVFDNVARTVRTLVDSGKDVYIVLQTPLNPGFDPRQMIRRTFASPGFSIVAAAADRTATVKTFEPFISRLREIALKTGAKVVDPMDSLCNASTCSSMSNIGDPVFRDSFHLRKDYIQNQINYLDEAIVQSASLGRLARKSSGP